MGMSAAQARLLSITARLTDNELRSQMITNSKLRLADQSSEASAEYMDALNTQQLMYSYYNDNGEKTSISLTPNTLMTYSDLKNQYAMVNSAGQILVSGTDVKNFEESKTLNEFLRASGVQLNSDLSSIEIPDNILESAFNLLKDVFPCWGSTGIQGLTGNDRSFNPYYAAHIEHVLASLLWEDTNEEQSITISNGVTTETIINNANSMVVNDSDAILNIAGMFSNQNDIYAKYEKVLDENGNQVTRQFKAKDDTDIVTGYAWKLKGSDSDQIYYTTFNESYFNSDGSINEDSAIGTPGWYPNYQGTGEQYVLMYSENNEAYGLTLGSNYLNDKYDIKEVLDNNEDLKERLEILYYQVLLYLQNTGGTNPANHGGVDGGGMLGYRGLVGGSITENGAFSQLSVDELIDEFIDVMSELTVDLTYDIYSSNDERMDMFENIDGYEQIDAVMTDCIYDKTDPQYRWYVNLWYRMGGTDGVKTTNDTGKYKEIDSNFLNNSEWLQFALENGIITLEQASYSETGSQEYPNMGTYDWVSISYTNASDITSQDDNAAIAIAEVKYENTLREIENQDKKYDQDLKTLDSEHSALQTEYDSIKGVIDKNVERSFKAFS